MTYHVAVVGLGRIGWLADRDPVRPKPASHVSAWQLCPRANLVAVCDVDETKLEEACPKLAGDGFLGGWVRADDLPPGLDIVSIATPPETHREIVEACAAKARLIICEKPLAGTSKDAEAMVEACRASGTILLVNHGRRFHPGLAHAVAALPDRLGPLLTATVHYNRPLWDGGGSHAADFALWALGPAQKINHLIVWHATGSHSAFCAYNIAEYVIFQADVLGERGWAQFDLTVPSVRWHGARPGYALADGHRHLMPTGQEAWPPTTFLGEMAAHAVAVLDGKAVPLCTGEDGLAAVRVLEALESSS